MICPDCQSINLKKNGLKRGKQNHICSDCGGQFIDVCSERRYPQEVKKRYLHLYQEGNGGCISLLRICQKRVKIKKVVKS